MHSLSTPELFLIHTLILKDEICRKVSGRDLHTPRIEELMSTERGSGERCT